MEIIVLFGVIAIIMTASAIQRGSNKHERKRSRQQSAANILEFERIQAGAARSKVVAKDLSQTEKRTITGLAWVTDGDSIKVNKVELRLFGIDAPELNHPYGKQAKWALHKMCKGHQIHAEIVDVDHFERTVARCYLPDGRDLSAEMVKLGLALDWPKFSDGAYKHLEVEGVRKKLFLADARQKGRMHVWQKFEANQKARQTSSHDKDIQK